MTTSSRIPAVTDALVSVVTTAIGTSAKVFDGPGDSSTASSTSWVTVGATTNDDDTVFSQTWAGSGGFQRNEDVNIPCELRYVTGKPGFSALRSSTFALLALIENALRADPTLGVTGYTVRAQLASGEYTGDRAGVGTGAPVLVGRIRFTVHVETRI